MHYRILAIHAHPDDESSQGGALLARYAHQGHEVMVVTATGGERGNYRGQVTIDPSTLRMDLAALRRQEMKRAAAILGVQHQWLGFTDSGFYLHPEDALPNDCFAQIPLDLVTRSLVRVIRQFRPHILLTYDNSLSYPHPDHLRCHTATKDALIAASDPHYFPALAPWNVTKLYFLNFYTREKVNAYAQALRRNYASEYIEKWVESLYIQESCFGMPATTHVPCSEYFSLRDAALREHNSQVAPNDPVFFPLSSEAAAHIWPVEQLHLAYSRVPVAQKEDDILSGLDQTLLAQSYTSSAFSCTPPQTIAA